jgi:hypothetical protein
VGFHLDAPLVETGFFPSIFTKPGDKVNMISTILACIHEEWRIRRELLVRKKALVSSIDDLDFYDFEAFSERFEQKCRCP